MSPIASDIFVRTTLESTLAIAQAFLLNRLGLPFAGITVFSGLAAYGLAVTLRYGLLATWPVLAFGLLVLLLYIVLAPRLPEDRCLLLSLAALAVARALAGALPWLGGQLGMTTATAMLRPQQAARFVPWAAAVFLLAIAVAVLLQKTLFGLRVDVAWMERSELLARALVPIGAIRSALLICAAAMGCATGFLMSCYSGRVDPDSFRMDTAITVLVVSLAAGRTPLRLMLVPVLFFAFPDVFASFTGYQRAALAHAREIVWGLAILVLAGHGFAPGSDRDDKRASADPAVLAVGEVGPIG